MANDSFNQLADELAESPEKQQLGVEKGGVTIAEGMDVAKQEMRKRKATPPGVAKPPASCEAPALDKVDEKKNAVRRTCKFTGPRR